MAANATKAQGGSITAETVISVMSAGDAAGYTADDLAATLGLPGDGALLQHELEDMVRQGLLDRRGLGRGALYTLVAPMMAAKDAPTHAGSPGTATKGTMVQKAG